MEIKQKGKTTIAIFNSPEEYKNELLELNQLDVDLVEIRDDSNTSKLSNLWGTNIIGWAKEITQDFYSNIEPKYHKYMRKTLNKAEKEGITYTIFEGIDKQNFSKWFYSLYKPFMDSKNSKVIIDEDWADSISGKKHNSIFFFNKEKELIAGNFFYNKVNTTSFSYKAISHNLPIDINPFIEYTCHKIALNNNSRILKKGIDYNLYGGDLNTGLSKYKLKYGFKPYSFISEKKNSFFRYLIVRKRNNLSDDSITFTAKCRYDHNLSASNLF